ncbi:GSCOCG00013142001-RA-CDS [Cotesia congregata]|uniref:Similar to MROH1: Maestro heat-like repeat-containing protein family member 1 (Homo sapiens) n=1 Tax=Cotesia congregata TaxID=51543 RepID=A0A8J2MLX2_COTCN|nr:GSCOCG00013142001-RA-CDS [Cotesia congregata]CAG5093015.1 Similar to MROH1: Maestro heat-like repeat-containing protein family member 1 (Homo sapiens) [Cotesia congregata]
MKCQSEDKMSELSAVVGALLDGLNDKSDQVTSCINESIRQISTRSPAVVLHATIYYFELHKKITPAHTSAILRIITDTLNSISTTNPTTDPNDNSIENSNDNSNEESNSSHQTLEMPTLADSVAELAVEKLSEFEVEATEVLVALGNSFCNQAIGNILNKFEFGSIPKSSAMIRALGLIAASNPYDVVPFIKLTLTFVLPFLNQAQEEHQKLALCFVVGKFAEAINEYLGNLGMNSESRITRDSFAEEASFVFEFLTGSSWLKPVSATKNRLAEAVLSALCPILLLLPTGKNLNETIKLIPSVLNFCKHPTTRFAATKLIATILIDNDRHNDNQARELLRPHLEPIQQILFELVNVTPAFETRSSLSRDALLTHYEVLQCYRAIVTLYPEEGLDLVLHHLRSPAPQSHRGRALVIIRHLINTLPTEDDLSLQRIALSIQNILGDSGGATVRYLAGPIIALLAHPSLNLLPSQRANLIRFIIIRCGDDTESQAYEEALFLLANTVAGAENWLWTALLKALLDPTYSLAVVPILRGLAALVGKVVHQMDNEGSNSFKEFSGSKVLKRCLELLDDDKNCLAVVSFLKSAAPLFGHQLKPEWDISLGKISSILEEGNDEWKNQMVELMETSRLLEGADWAGKLSNEMVQGETIKSSTTIYLAAVTDNPNHLSTLVDLSRLNPFNEVYSQAVGIAAKRHLSVIMTRMQEACDVIDSQKNPTKLFGLMKNASAVTVVEATKASLLRCYGEIFATAKDSELVYKTYIAENKHVLPWIVKQLTDCKEVTTKEAGLFALEQLAKIVAAKPNSEDLTSSVVPSLKTKGACLATLLSLLQSHTGYRPIQLYPQLLKTMIALLKVPPMLTVEEQQVLMGTILDKVIGSSAEIDLILKKESKNYVVQRLGAVSSAMVGDSANNLAEFVEIIMPWMESKTPVERKMTLLVLRTTLKSYCHALKYTYPEGKLEAGKLLGRIICWSADSERLLRPIIIDSLALTLEIAARHHSSGHPFVEGSNDLEESKLRLISEDIKSPDDVYEGVLMLAKTVCQRVTPGEVVAMAEGLIEGFLLREENSLAAGITLSQLFRIRGDEIPRSDLYLIDNIVTQMRQIENASCRHAAATAIKSLTLHHPEEVIEHLLHQPLPPDRGTEESWRELGSDEETGLVAVDFLVNRLENNNLFAEAPSPTNGSLTNRSDVNKTASLASLAAVIALGHVLQSAKSELLINSRLAELITCLIKYLAGWLHADTPASVLSTKFGFVPNRKACKLNPYRQVYTVLTNLLTVIDINVASGLLNDNPRFESDTQASDSLISTVRSVLRCFGRKVGSKDDLLISVAQSIGKLVTSQIATQRAVAIAFYGELIGQVDADPIWLDSIITTLLEARSDSSFLVRKLAIQGLSNISKLDAQQLNEFYDNSVAALLDGLEELPTNGGLVAGGGSQVILESLRGLETLLGLQTTGRAVSPRVVLSLKSFVDKQDNWDIRLAAVGALGAVSRGWLKSLKTYDDDDVSDHLLGCLPCLTVRLEDVNSLVAKAARETLVSFSNLLQSLSLAQVIRGHLSSNAEFDVEHFYRELVKVLVIDLPVRAQEMRNAMVRGYSRSEVAATRATAVLILGFFGQPRPEDVQRMLQLLRDKDNSVKSRAARALAFGFTT